MRVWFTKKVKDSNVALTRFEAIDLLQEISKLVNEGRIGAAMQKLGMDQQPFDESLSLEELAEIFSVRLTDLAKYAGVKL